MKSGIFPVHHMSDGDAAAVVVVQYRILLKPNSRCRSIISSSGSDSSELQPHQFCLYAGYTIGADSMGAIAPTAKKLLGRCREVAPTGILLCHFLSQLLRVGVVYSQNVQ